MDELQMLSRKEVIDLYEKYHPYLSVSAYEFGQKLRELKPILYQKHGEWIEHHGELKPFECSRCRVHQKIFTDYCPSCGSKNFI